MANALNSNVTTKINMLNELSAKEEVVVDTGLDGRINAERERKNDFKQTYKHDTINTTKADL